MAFKHEWLTIQIPFDPIQRSKEVELIVMKDNARAYYRFRYAKFYGGIITADAVGCNLLCCWGDGCRCWNFSRNKNPAGKGEFMNLCQAAQELLALSEKHHCQQFRLSGCEPFLGSQSANHLYEVIRRVKGEFVIETNGVMLGFLPELLDYFPKKARLRISLKGSSEKQSARITSASGVFALQMNAIQEASKRNIRCTVATMKGFVDASKLRLPTNVSREIESPIGKRL